MPMVTMRSYSEEKRSGTIELLLTSPITDFQIVLGKFLGAMALYGVMLLTTLIHLGLLFVYGGLFDINTVVYRVTALDNFQVARIV